jgi:hypothetical protein
MSASSLSLAGLSAALPDLTAEARARSLEFEDRRNLAPDFVEKLKVVGAFKVLVPTEAGGLGGSLPQFLELPWQWPRPTRRAGGWRRMPTFAPD